MNQSDSRGSVGHSADLRTRIAAVLTGYVDHSHRYDLADAVIRELGLRDD